MSDLFDELKPSTGSTKVGSDLLDELDPQQVTPPPEIVQPTLPVQEDTLANRSSARRQEAVGKVQQDISDFAKSPSKEAAFGLIGDIAGQSAWAGIDVLGDTLFTGLKTVAETAPDKMQDAVKAGFHSLTNAVPSEVKLSISSGTKDLIDIYGDLEEKYPEEMRQVENIAGILMVAMPGPKANPAAKPFTPIGKAGAKLTRSAKVQAAKSKRELVETLIEEIPTDEFSRKMKIRRSRETTLLRGRDIKASPLETMVAKDVSRVPGLNPKRSFLYNSNRVVDESRKVAEDVATKLANLPEPNDSLLKNAINKVDLGVNKLLKEETFLAESKTAVQNMVTKAKSLISSTDNSASGVWEARKAFDQWVIKQKGKYPDPNKAGAFEQVNEVVRNSLNGVVHTEAKKHGVNSQRAMEKLFHLNLAETALVPKVEKEGVNAFYRQMTKLKDVVGVRNESLGLIATAMGTTFLAASQTAAAPVAATIAAGSSLRLMYKAAKTPQFKRSVGLLLKATDDGLKVATDPIMIQQLRADRALLIELSEHLDKQEEE